MKIIRKFINELSDIEKKEVDAFIEANEGTIFHETKFNDVASDVFKTKPFYFVAYSQGSMVGICPVHVLRKGILRQLFSSLSSNEVPYGGWVYDRNETSIEALLDNTKIRFNEGLFYWSTIQRSGNGYLNMGKYLIRRYNTVILSLDSPLEKIYEISFKAKQRNKIKRAQKLGIYVESINYADIDQFVDLSFEMKNHKGIPFGLPEFYKKVIEIYKIENKVVCLAAKYNDKYISSMILVANRNYTIAWVAGRKADLPNNLYQNELLWWESIRWAKRFGSRWLDLCGLDEVNLPNLARIKLSFSKEIVPFYFLTRKKLLFRIINRIQNAFYN